MFLLKAKHQSDAGAPSCTCSAPASTKEEVDELFYRLQLARVRNALQVVDRRLRGKFVVACSNHAGPREV